MRRRSSTGEMQIAIAFAALGTALHSAFDGTLSYRLLKDRQAAEPEIEHAGGGHKIGVAEV